MDFSFFQSLPFHIYSSVKSSHFFLYNIFLDWGSLTHFFCQSLGIVTLHPRVRNPNLSTSQLLSSKVVSGCDDGLLNHAGYQWHISSSWKNRDSHQWPSGFSTSLLNCTLCSAQPHLHPPVHSREPPEPLHLPQLPLRVKCFQPSGTEELCHVLSHSIFCFY